MDLSEDDKQQITKILKKKNKYHWTDSICIKAVEIVQKIRDGDVKLTDWFVQDVLTFEDYIYNLNLIKFVT